MLMKLLAVVLAFGMGCALGLGFRELSHPPVHGPIQRFAWTGMKNDDGKPLVLDTVTGQICWPTPKYYPIGGQPPYCEDLYRNLTPDGNILYR